ncbi:MAG: hypothetical protein JNM22_14765 [Saprospiraceae bacterium]|nr:hypothetical protein [Saprospiraceae bacterium]
MEDLFSEKIGLRGCLRAGCSAECCGKNCWFDRRIKSGFNAMINFLFKDCLVKFYGETIADKQVLISAEQSKKNAFGRFRMSNDDKRGRNQAKE